MNIAIIGCGYLGKKLAQYWSSKGHHVTATTRHPERLEELSKVSQKSIILKGSDEDALAPVIAKNELILVAVAPDRNDQYELTYLNTASAFRHVALGLNAPRHLIYISSTSVYGDHQGLWVDETSELKATSDQGKILIEAEKLYLSLEELGWQRTIFRFAELYGPGRELSQHVKKLSGQTLPGSGDSYTNMVHLLDATFAIDYACRHHLEGIYNLADDEHPTRKELYDRIAEKFKYPKVQWDSSLKGLFRGNKRVSNHKIKAEGFSFHHAHRVLD